jgi:hypothetical protein
LRSLQFEFNLDDPSDDARLVTQMLSQISSAHMEEVGLEISVGSDDRVGQVRWNEIDAALQHSSFSGLKTVSVRVVQWPFLYDSDQHVVSRIKDLMPICHARGILRVREMVWQSSYFLP